MPKIGVGACGVRGKSAVTEGGGGCLNSHWNDRLESLKEVALTICSSSLQSIVASVLAVALSV